MEFNIKNWQDKHLIKESKLRELDFKTPAEFKAYKAKHPGMRKTTKVNIAGKDTTAGQASGGKVAAEPKIHPDDAAMEKMTAGDMWLENPGEEYEYDTRAAEKAGFNFKGGNPDFSGRDNYGEEFEAKVITMADQVSRGKMKQSEMDRRLHPEDPRMSDQGRKKEYASQNPNDAGTVINGKTVNKKERTKLYKKHNTWRKDADKNINRERYTFWHKPDINNPEELKNTKITTPPEFRASVESELRYPGTKDDDQWTLAARDAIDKADTETINSAIDFLDAHLTTEYQQTAAKSIPGGEKWDPDYKGGWGPKVHAVYKDPDQYSRILASILSGNYRSTEYHGGEWTPPNETGTTKADFNKNYDKNGNRKTESITTRSTRIQESRMYKIIQELRGLEKSI